MKISNNALNFLLAQYRAIFKRAYVKGIASAVLLTAGLAAGQAQADGDLATTAQLPSEGQTAIITGQSQTDPAYDPNSQEAEFQFVVIGASGNGKIRGTAQDGISGRSLYKAFEIIHSACYCTEASFYPHYNMDSARQNGF